MGTKLLLGYFVLSSFVKLMVEIILYRKYNGPVNKFSWWPVVIVKVFEWFKSLILFKVVSEAFIWAYCFSSTETKTSLFALPLKLIHHVYDCHHVNAPTFLKTIERRFHSHYRTHYYYQCYYHYYYHYSYYHVHHHYCG